MYGLWIATFFYLILITCIIIHSQCKIYSDKMNILYKINVTMLSLSILSAYNQHTFEKKMLYDINYK